MREPLIADPLFSSSLPLVPGDAAVALILLPAKKYLLQLRDPLPQIFYPDHWGFFGGGVEAGESPEKALVRELEEELGLTVAPGALDYFTDFSFDFAFAGRPLLHRRFYTLTLESIEGLTLQEGAKMQAFDAYEALGTLRLVPYDSFALWMHAFGERLKPASI